MTCIVRPAAACLILSVCFAQTTPTQQRSQPSQLPSRDQQELFLQTAEIRNQKELTEGTTHTVRVTLSDGRLTHDAHVQFVDIYRPLFRGKDGTVEKNFRDSYKFNIAAYRLDKLLQLNMIPVSVERQYNDKWSSFTWWVDDVWMDEAARRDKKIKPPADQNWIDQLNKVRVFDQLIANVDRNQGNLLITHDWRLWMIDHTRAFRTQHTLLRPEVLERCDQKLLDNMRQLTRAQLDKELGPYLRSEEIAALLARRDVIVHFFETEIRSKGVDAVLTGIPRKTPEVSVP